MKALDEGPLRRAVLHVALPATAFQLLIFLNNFVDYFWLQRLGNAAAAGQSQGWTVFWVLTSIGQIFSTGITAVVARRVGERRLGDATHAATHGLRGALLSAVAIGTIGWILVPPVAAASASSAKAAGYTVDYLRTLCAGAPILFLFFACEGTFKGRGDMRRPMRAFGTAVLLNAVLDPLLIFKLHLEVLGAALATVIALGVTGGLLAYSGLRRGWILGGLGGVDWALFRRIVRIGMPVSLHGIVFSLVYIFIFRETNLAGGDAAGSALGLGLRLEGVAYQTSVGFASAAAAVVGQCLGAGNVPRAGEGAWTAVKIGAWIGGTWGFVLLVLPEPVVGWLSSSDAAALHALDYCRIVAVSVAFTSVEIILEGAFSGAGDTRPALFLGLPLTVARIPAAMLAVRVLGMGVSGVFWALTWTSVLRGLAMALWFARGRWAAAPA
ncbi:MAG TPA: MATE family efflux transporter [Planctomycetota bacterium]|nr:MATE family efflux transporter [Planctomycetota bacterium]